MAAECGKRREDSNCDSCGWQGHTNKVCLTIYEEKNYLTPKKRDKTPSPSVRVTKEAPREPWMTDDEDEGDDNHIHLMRPAAIVLPWCCVPRSGRVRHRAGRLSASRTRGPRGRW